MKAIKLVISRYRNREAMLFANNNEHSIPRTNNGMEQFFRKLRRNIRKRCGNIATGNMLANNGVSLAIFQNIENEDYVKAVYGNSDIASVLAKYIKPYRSPGMTHKRIIQLVEKGTDMIINGRINSNPYTDKLFQSIKSVRI
jgi:hypothetical protein